MTEIVPGLGRRADEAFSFELYDERFKGHLSMKMKPSEYWSRQCRATFQDDPVGLELLGRLGEDNVMWGSDYPHPDCLWPDFNARQLDKAIASYEQRERRYGDVGSSGEGEGALGFDMEPPPYEGDDAADAARG